MQTEIRWLSLYANPLLIFLYLTFVIYFIWRRYKLQKRSDRNGFSVMC